ncbi:alcohol dehydrogenase [Pseudoclavibacter endophyticus]|uniref:Zinc-binding dehydrogenase n=1 Tax=Pseudoclavibacter endophyticus TaxID=1778590 RepID=A0A6H9WPM6_9MICO|nr:zinc-binding dehydrogenase [Pseudoclavibacter endophyticus]KAB1648061.1 zinc-binding dehydrogenase [Pseudoclavibacter endophyticus]GGA69375.1 alcohol dehydrogenase [Pseudoclavibacter endophyticus]
MLTALMRGVDQPVSIEEVEPLPAGPTDLVVEIEASGVCHSDISAMRGYLGLANPTIIGHEVSGTVLEVGTEVRGFTPGDRVIGSLVPQCGSCSWCLNGQTHLCATTMSVRERVRARTSDGLPVTAMLGLGAFAERMTIDQQLAVKVNSDLPSDQLALIGCGIATGAGAAMFTAGVRPGSSVAVVGCGGVGQAAVQGARIAGAAQIIAVDPISLKREHALRNGATHVVDPAAGGTPEQVRALTHGRGVDVAIEVVGIQATVLDAYHSARRGGTVATVGIPAPDTTISLPATDFFRAEKRVVGSYYGSTQVRTDFQKFADLIEAGRFDAESMITHHYRLPDVQQAFDDLEAGGVVRGVIRHD